MRKELIRTYRRLGITLKVYDLNKLVNGKWNLGYKLTFNNKVIFAGNDFYNSPLHSIDSFEVVRSLLTFLTARPGDTDDEYFANYTDRQMEFCQSFEAEQIACYIY